MHQINLLTNDQPVLEVVQPKRITSPKKLRAYQKKLISEYYATVRQGIRETLLIAAPGSGKTFTVANILRDVCWKGKKVANRCIFLVSMSSLLNQTAAEIRSIGVPCTILQGQKKYDRTAPIVVASLQTIDARLRKGATPYELLGEAGLIVVDEAHTAAFSDAYQAIRQEYLQRNNTYFLGLTGTPYRTAKDEYLGMYFRSQVEAPQPPEIVRMSGILPARCYGINDPKFQLSKVGMSAKDFDFDDKAIEKITMQLGFAQHVVSEYKRLTPNTKAAGFYSTVKAAEFMADQFNQAGIKSVVLTGSTSLKDREAIKQQMAEGSVMALHSVNAVTAGFDLPILQTILYCTATVSLAKFHQGTCRASRPYPGQDCFHILDFGGNFDRGFPSPTDFQDYYIGEKRTKEKGEAPLKGCPQCSLMMPSFRQVCPDCGYRFTQEEDEQIVLDVQLVEIMGKENAEKITWLKQSKQTAFVNDVHPETPIRDFIQRYGHIPFDDWQKGLVLGDRPGRNLKDQYLDYLRRHAANDIQLRHWQRLEFGKTAR